VKVKIDKNGWLQIKRKKKLKPQYCPFTPGDEEPCGDWCPLFNEPEQCREDRPKPEIYLCICHTDFIVEIQDFEDLR
jgi:hypothetical protein